MRKRNIFIGIAIGLVCVISIGVVKTAFDSKNTDIISDLEGTLYYTRRVEGVSTLFKSDAQMDNETLVYSHEGKGQTQLSDDNDNIIDFCYYPETDHFQLIAMDKGIWSEFKLDASGNSPIINKVGDSKEHVTSLLKTSYIQTRHGNKEVIEDEGSLYLIQDNQESVMMPFRGLYDDKFTGYSPVGFSPDGQYFIYKDMGHLTPIGTIVEGLIKDQVGKMYIYELETGKRQEIEMMNHIQWEK